MFEHINRVQSAVELLQVSSHADIWAEALENTASQDSIHGLVRGRACRLLYDRKDADESISMRMSQALSPGTPARQSAAWLEGFLHGSGQALIHHPRLWRMVDDWLISLPEDTFPTILPLLRRTFSMFPAPERRQLGEMARLGGRAAGIGRVMVLDPVRRDQALALVLKILEGA
jgi:hypothetical protein